MIRLGLLILAFGLACAGDSNLAVSGNVSIIGSDGTPTGFEFRQQTSLVQEELVDGTTTVFAGHCRIGRDEVGEQVISISVSRPAARVEGIQLRRFRLRAPESASASVDVDLGGDDYTATSGEGCDITLDYVVRDERLVGLSFDCEIHHNEDSAQAEGELRFEGCGVD